MTDFNSAYRFSLNGVPQDTSSVSTQYRIKRIPYHPGDSKYLMNGLEKVTKPEIDIHTKTATAYETKMGCTFDINIHG